MFHLADKRFAQLATPDMPDVRVGDSATQALGVSNVPYRQLVSWDGNYDDYYLVKLADGSRQKILDKEHFGATVSPGGQLHPLFRRGRRQLVHGPRQRRPEDEPHQGLGVKFQSETDDRPEHPTPYGQAGWTDGDKSVLLYDRYDIWEVQPDGSGAADADAGLGRKQQIVFRYSRTEAAAADAGTRKKRPARGVRPTSPRFRRRGRCCCRRWTSGPRRAGCTACVHRQRRAGEGRDARQGVRRADQGAQRRRLRVHAVAVRGVPAICGRRAARSPT